MEPRDACGYRREDLDQSRERQATPAHALRIEHREQRLEVRDAGRHRVEGQRRIELRRAPVRDVIGPDRVERAVAKRRPERLDILALAERRLPDPERRVRPRKALAREIEVERARLAQEPRAPFLSLAEAVQRPTRREMHEVESGAAELGMREGRAHRDDLRLHRPALGEPFGAGPAGGMQLGGGPVDHRAVLRMHRDDDAGRGRGAVQVEVVRGPLDEVRRDHEDLQAVALAGKRRHLVDRGGARVGDDHVEREVRARSRGVAKAALRAGPERAFLIDHRAHRRHAARHGGARAVLEVVERRERGRAREMRVQIDAAWQHELAARVDLARGARDVADRGDPLVVDREVGAAFAVRRHDRAAADREGRAQAPSSSRRDRRSASSCCERASMSSSISPSIRRSRFERL